MSQLEWREPNTPLDQLQSGQIALVDPPEGKDGLWVVLRNHQGVGAGPLQWTNPVPHPEDADKQAVHLKTESR